jgi:hypothetical protein
MKSILLMLLLLLSVYTISAQLTITPGSQFSMSGNVQLTLQNTNLVNNGSFITGGNSITSFTGNTSSSVSGSQPIQFNELEINKTNNSSVLLQKAIGVGQRTLFTSGFLNLNGFNADLGSTGHLDGEQENTRIIGSNGGEVLFNANLNAPSNSNPANLGIIITTGTNLGNVTIKRGHQSQVNSVGLGNSIFRYYDIIPANNSNLNATLRFNYFDGELNGLTENAIAFFESQNNTNWTSLGFNSRDVAANFVEKTGIGNFGRFTLSTIGNPLPVQFILFNAKCENNRILITWKTAQEQNSSHFNIERSADGIRWTVIGNLPAASNSSSESSYSFTDNTPLQNNFYRIAEYDLDGRVQYTGILRSSCNATDVFNLWPNPVHDRIFINIVSGNATEANIKIFDSKGALIKIQKANILRGSNQLSVDMVPYANGIYPVSVDWNNGQTKKTTQIVKQ